MKFIHFLYVMETFFSYWLYSCSSYILYFPYILYFSFSIELEIVFLNELDIFYKRIIFFNWVLLFQIDFIKNFQMNWILLLSILSFSHILYFFSSSGLDTGFFIVNQIFLLHIYYIFYVVLYSTFSCELYISFLSEFNISFSCRLYSFFLYWLDLSYGSESSFSCVLKLLCWL